VTALRQEVRRLVPASVRMRLRPPPAWSVSVLHAASPLDLASSQVRRVPVIDEVDLHRHGLTLAADPFAVRRAGVWSLFVEVLPRGSRSADIAVLTSPDLDDWTYRGTVLHEPFHLSYPRVVADRDEIYLVPECYATTSVRAYRAVDFPHRWELAATLLRGRPFKDATPFRHGDHWFLLVETSEHTHDQLCLYVAERLLGPWHEHPASPIVTADARLARPAGAPVEVGGQLVRFAQDCATRYGRAVRAVEILELTPTTYRERLLPDEVIGADGTGWHAGGAHHVDAHRVEHGWICFVDGHR
jgi:hypothetical protein